MIKIKHKFLRKLKAQVALEFLMTYGWAIMLVLVAMGALAYFGVLSPDRFIPNRCSLPAGIACSDYTIGSSSVNLVLQNGLGQSITLTKVTVTEESVVSCSNAYLTLVQNSQKAIVTVSNCNNGNVGERFKGDLDISYTKESGITGSVHGSLFGRIAEGSDISSLSICQNADSGGLCEGLDIVYGAGYRAACCSEHTLCCP